MRVKLLPEYTVALVGLTLPLAPADEVTINSAPKVADTVQLLVIEPVVYVFPDKVPPQPVTDAM